MPNKRVAIVTGSDRGIGFEVARSLGELGYQVILTSPTPKNGLVAAKKLSREGFSVFYHVLDVANESSIFKLHAFILKKFGQLDVLVNNAGVMIDSGRSKIEGLITRRLVKKVPKKMDFGEGRGILEVDMDLLRATLEVNTLGALRMCQIFIPLMMKAHYGRIVNVSSGLGQLSGMSDVEKVPAYQMSKTALNAVTLMVADAVRGHNIAVNSVCPGWTRTDIGGPEAPQSPQEAAKTITWLAAHTDGGPTAGFFRDKKRIDW